MTNELVELMNDEQAFVALLVLRVGSIMEKGDDLNRLEDMKKRTSHQRDNWTALSQIIQGRGQIGVSQGEEQSECVYLTGEEKERIWRACLCLTLRTLTRKGKSYRAGWK